MSTQKTTKKKIKSKIDPLGDNGAASGDEATVKTTIGKHIEIPESNEYFMDIKRKQNNDKMFLNLQLKGPKDSKDFKVNLTYPDYDLQVPKLIDLSISALERFKADYKVAQLKALEQTPRLDSFFLVD